MAAAVLKRLLGRPWVQRRLAGLLAAWLLLVHRTTRWRIAMDPASESLLRAGAPLILAVWHERVALLVCTWRHFPDPARRPVRPLHFMISGHRDGRLIAAVAARLGIGSVEGSSSRGGGAAFARMLALLDQGQAVVGITPDGPRGPRRAAQPGVAVLAQRSGCPVVCVAAATARNRRMRSWDRMMLPLPFGPGALVVGAPLALARGEAAESALAAVKAALDEACARADAMVGLAPG